MFPHSHCCFSYPLFICYKNFLLAHSFIIVIIHLYFSMYYILKQHAQNWKGVGKFIHFLLIWKDLYFTFMNKWGFSCIYCSGFTISFSLELVYAFPFSPRLLGFWQEINFNFDLTHSKWNLLLLSCTLDNLFNVGSQPYVSMRRYFLIMPMRSSMHVLCMCGSCYLQLGKLFLFFSLKRPSN